MQEIDVEITFRLIEPGPVLPVTCGADGPNVTTMGFHLMVKHVPPLVGCVIGPWDHNLRALLETDECELSVPCAEMGATATDIGNTSGADTDKFERFGIETMPSSAARPRLLSVLSPTWNGASSIEPTSALGGFQCRLK
ncbi:flavin reductase [Mesorhizobium sp. VK25A]|uniref:Flavin reductase n=1 Tax=Mesorhizobium vachelliae TaxID=3072309 RepID=A0ABU4ZY24_9HYPH|nr:MULTISPECIES: flavin reductase [unclassified Mesorhizobium]MDX8530329.1 flavin reductase [Mesorhizobium sp. VK25D]MDX8542306.1 flavin reductase [Mesorhizobium sp. VK25A]